MAKSYTWITEEQSALIRNAAVFFVASADPELGSGLEGVGPVNLSPKGGTLHILSPNRVAYLDYPGSGNETARHVSAGGPATLMICCFDKEDAAIVRLYGKATATPFEDSRIAEQLLGRTTPQPKSLPRQVIEIEVASTMTSCGYGVPIMNLVRDRRRPDRGRRYKE